MFPAHAAFVLHNCLHRGALAAVLGVMDQLLFHDAAGRLCRVETVSAVAGVLGDGRMDAACERAVACLASVARRHAHVLRDTPGLGPRLHAVHAYLQQHPFEPASDEGRLDLQDIRAALDP